MQPFDPLDTNIDVSTSFFLEASAGTGKTFSIEHIVQRLVRENKYSLENIACVTFTNKAADELRMRILERLEGVQKSHIFTIHGFCLHWLKELKGFELQIETDGREQTTDWLRLFSDEISVGEATRLIRRYPNEDNLVDALKKPVKSSCMEEFTKGIIKKELDSDLLLEDFVALAFNYKGLFRRDNTLHPDILHKAKVLSRDPYNPETLFLCDALFIEAFAPENQKKKRVDVTLHYPDFFREMQELLPLWREVSTPHKIAERLAYLLEEKKRSHPDFEARPSYDALLEQLDALLDDPEMCAQMVKQLKMIIIDEFQDTCAVQWSIFSKLMHAGSKCIVVGDPKQAIYAFRKADIYTFFAARKEFERHYYLATNYRADPKLTEQLNRFFSLRNGDFLWLPKENRTEPFVPVRTPDKLDLFENPIKLLTAEVVKPDLKTQEQLLFPFVANELVRLYKEGFAWKRSAILVRDRYQMTAVVKVLEASGIPVSADYEVEVCSSPAYPLLRAFLEPTSQILFTEFFALSDRDERGSLPMQLFEELHLIAEREGLPSALEAGYQNGLKRGPLTKELFALANLYEKKGRSLDFSWKVFEKEACRVSADDGVVVTTMHKSKGLEYDIVFALGLIQRGPASDDSEKLRQLYVTLTRAKHALYIPCFLAKKAPLVGTASSLELFLGYVFSDNLSFMYSRLTDLALKEVVESLGFPQIPLVEEALPFIEAPVLQREELSYSIDHRETASYSSLIRPHAVKAARPGPDELPVGTETGLYVHEIIRRSFVMGNYRNFTQEAFDKAARGVVPLSFLAKWKKSLFHMVKEAFDVECSVGGHIFKLRLIPQEHLMTEVPFLHDSKKRGAWMKGFIDLLIWVDGRLIIADWKTNWLEKYDSEALDEAMRAHDYYLQAEVYDEAARAMQLPWIYEQTCGLYLFLRGEPTAQIAFSIDHICDKVAL